MASRQLVDRIIECAHRQVLHDPAAQQRILFKQLAHAMGLDSETVADAFMDGGGNGISFNVTEEDRDTIRRLVASKSA